MHAALARPRTAVVLVGLISVLLTGCLPAQLGGRPPSFDAFLRRNGLEFTPGIPPPDLRVADVRVVAQREGPAPGMAINPPVYGVLSCPVSCSGAVLSQRGETMGLWFVSYPGTEYGLGDIAWVLVDPFGVSVLSTRDNP